MEIKLYFIKQLLIFLLLIHYASVHAAETPVIAAAASVKFALQDIAAAFRQDTGKSVRLSFASSGNLTRQIQQGAPFELFLSANTAYVDQLQQQKLAHAQKVVYALGRLVLLTTLASPLTLDEELQGIRQALQTRKLKHFAIANPELAPYGAAAREVLQHRQLWSSIQSSLVLGENVAQATQFAASGAAQVGLVSYSLALAPQLKNKTRFVLIPQAFHKPLAQTMVLLNPAGDTAKLFYRYMQQHKAQQILNRYGYSRS